MKKLFCLLFLFSIIATKSYPESAFRADTAYTDIKIKTSFSGAEIFVYGALDKNLLSNSIIFVEVLGPKKNYQVRKKLNRFGIWIIEKRKTIIENIPSYYAFASSAKFNEVSYAKFLNNKLMFFEKMKSNLNLPIDDNKDYHLALKRNLKNNGLFYENTNKIEILNNKLFKVFFKLPAITPTGVYTINIFLVNAEKNIISKLDTFIEVKKEGLTEKLFDYSKKQSLLYGIFAALGAIIAGFLASEIFRRF